MMNVKTLLAVSLLMTSLVAAMPAHAKKIVTGATAYDAASDLIAYTTHARYALADNNPDLAKKYIIAAKTAGTKLAALAEDKRKVSNIQSGRLSYEMADGQKDGAYYYYPVKAATVTAKNIAFGPFWAETKGLAVKDAEYIYVTVNLAGVDVQKDLSKAIKEIDNKDYDDASDQLQDVIEDVLTVEDRKEAYALKARDNLELARNYMEHGNYTAARFPLKHAESALESMKGNDRYAAQQDLVKKYLKEIDRSKDVIEDKDPTALEKLKGELKADWEGMKDWADKKMN